jgi:outer membrane protein assembly factor BamB
MKARTAVAPIVTLLVIVACARAVPAQEWAQWRGPTRDGVAKNFSAPGAWPKALTKKWGVVVGGGYSSPLVSGSRVYLHARQGEEETVSCFDLETGKLVWTKSYPAPFKKNQYAVEMGKGPNSTPVLYNGRLYTLGVGAVLSSFDARTGELKWRKEFPEPDTSKLFCGTAMSPVVERGALIVHVGDDRGGSVLALDASDGKVRWEWKGDGPGYSSPIVVDLAGVRQVVTLTDRSAVGVAADTGKLLWKMPFPDEWNENIVTPVLHKGRLILSGVRKGTMAVEVVKEGDAYTAKQVWHNPKVAMYMNSPVLDGDYLYGMSHLRKGQFFCLDARTGELLWATDGREGQNASVVSAGDFLLFLSADANLIVARKSPKGFEQAARYSVADSAIWAHPAVLGRRILVRDSASLALWAIE